MEAELPSITINEDFVGVHGAFHCVVNIDPELASDDGCRVVLILYHKEGMPAYHWSIVSQLAWGRATVEFGGLVVSVPGEYQFCAVVVRDGTSAEEAPRVYSDLVTVSILEFSEHSE
ncbi:hypothetical protein AAE478_009367 [Parahypoxylon ruwenzoriense]